MKPARYFDNIRLLVALLLIAGFQLGAGARAAWNSQEAAQAERAKKDDKKKRDLPLEPTRKVEFTTDEATWLSLDISPDGKTIVFELLGDFYTLPTEGGEAKRIAEGMGFDSQPRYSRDGKWLAFLSDRDGAENLWVAKADGTDARKLSKETTSSLVSPTWMPDSQYVLVSLSGRSGLNVHMYHIQGGSGISVTAPQQPPSPVGEGPGAPSLQRMGAVVSPEGRYLYFARKAAGSTYNQMSFGWQIVRRDLKTGDEDIITQAQGGAAALARRLEDGLRHSLRNADRSANPRFDHRGRPLAEVSRAAR